MVKNDKKDQLDKDIEEYIQFKKEKKKLNKNRVNNSNNLDNVNYPILDNDIEDIEDIDNYSDNEIISEIKEKEDINEKLVQNLFNLDKDIEIKTETSKPAIFSTISTIRDYLKEKNMLKSAELINTFMIYLQKYLISKNRQGRKEILEAIKTFNQFNENEFEDNPLLNSALNKAGIP
ncbi:MAG: hypothetical protein ACTSVV_08090 [Promethearchaeota archaeon]